jgi:hypothetical protein
LGVSNSHRHWLEDSTGKSLSPTAQMKILQIKSVLQTLSKSPLERSVARVGTLPNKATFQHLFMVGLALFTPPTCSIIPDLAETFPSQNGSISRTCRRIDFSLNSDLLAN